MHVVAGEGVAAGLAAHLHGSAGFHQLSAGLLQLHLGTSTARTSTSGASSALDLQLGAAAEGRRVAGPLLTVVGSGVLGLHSADGQRVAGSASAAAESHGHSASQIAGGVDPRLRGGAGLLLEPVDVAHGGGGSACHGHLLAGAGGQNGGALAQHDLTGSGASGDP
nr:hypothetical protein [Corynebacterium glutamicum]